MQPLLKQESDENSVVLNNAQDRRKNNRAPTKNSQSHFPRFIVRKIDHDPSTNRPDQWEEEDKRKTLEIRARALLFS